MAALRALAHLLLVAIVLGTGSRAHGLPIELKDENGTSYFINTDVDPLLDNSDASGAVTNATYIKPVTVTTYYVGLSPFGFFLTTYTQQRQVDIPLRNAFAGFNGLLITGINGTALPTPLVYNPAEGVSEDCNQDNKNRQLNFQPQQLPGVGLTVSRSVYVSHNAAFVRWLNVVTNDDSAPKQVGITLQGLLGSQSDTKIGATSSGDSNVNAGDLWFTSGQSVPQGTQSTQPTVGFVVQGDGAPVPAVTEGVNSLGQAYVTYNPTIPANGSVIILTLATVQGNFKEAKNTVENLVDLPSSTLKCMTEAQLAQVVNFPPITPPKTKNSTITLKFNKTGQDTVQWKGKVTVAAGVSLKGLPVTVDLGGATQTFVLGKSGSANLGDGDKFTLSASLSNGVTKEGTYSVSFNLKGDFQSLMATYGLSNATVKNVAVTVPLSITVGPGTYATDLPFTYKATEGKTGTATYSS